MFANPLQSLFFARFSGCGVTPAGGRHSASRASVVAAVHRSVPGVVTAALAAATPLQRFGQGRIARPAPARSPPRNFVACRPCRETHPAHPPPARSSAPRARPAPSLGAPRENHHVRPRRAPQARRRKSRAVPRAVGRARPASASASSRSIRSSASPAPASATPTAPRPGVGHHMRRPGPQGSAPDRHKPPATGPMAGSLTTPPSRLPRPIRQGRRHRIQIGRPPRPGRER